MSTTDTNPLDRGRPGAARSAGPSIRLPRPRAARPVCRHCAGTGREPSSPLEIEFSQSGPLRGAQQQVAESTGISVPMISLLVAGKRLGSLPMYVRLARHYGCTVDRLLSVRAIAARIREELRAERAPSASIVADPAEDF